ncbi:MAG TPA: response regulator, partial [Bacteroidetes bacterium]|nr:response regulator [Bacteroidota bacterium]
LAATFQYFFYRQKRKKQQIELALREELAEAHRLRQLDEMKTRFFTNISHELRTPLTLIISPLQQVLEKLKQTNLQTDLQLAWQNSKKLLRMVNEVLDLAKLESDTPPTKHSDIQMVPFLRRLFLSFQSAADFKKIRLEYQMDLPDDFLLQSDPSKLEKILNNLISNALKFTPKNGLVKMTAQSGPKSLVISVSDSGPGIHPDDLPHIFDRFFQSKRRENRLPEGTGIGLAIARQYAQLLKGQLNADSEWGKGSRFTLTLPAKQPSTRPRTTATATPPPPPHPTPRQAAGVANTRWSRPRLLIVEDNADMALYLQNALSKNYDCTTAPDGEAALQLLNQSRFDLITSDVMMPNMDGFTFRQKVSQHPAWRKIPFILLTARTLESDKLRGFRLGVDDYITKPFSLPEVEARIHNLLSNKALREAFDRDYPPPPANSGADEILLKNAEKLVLNKMDDPQFSVETMAKDLGFSPRHLSRTLGRLTGLSPVKFILEMRLQRARRLMENGQFKSVTEVRYEIGIESASYFTKKFKERFGKSPKACLEERNVKM